MATNKTKQIATRPPTAGRRARVDVMNDVCVHLKEGCDLAEACRRVPDARASTVLDWVKDIPELSGLYAQARAIGYALLADEINRVASETHAMVTVQETDQNGNLVFGVNGEPLLKQMLVPLNADVMASKRLRVDTMKWTLSKMLPKVYGDKVTQEHTGKDGGAIQIAAMDFKGLSDEELNSMRTLMLKANGGS